MADRKQEFSFFFTLTNRIAQVIQLIGTEQLEPKQVAQEIANLVILVGLLRSEFRKLQRGK